MGEFNWAALIAAALTAAVAIALQVVSARRDPRALKLLKDLDAVIATGGDRADIKRLQRVRAELLRQLVARLDPRAGDWDWMYRVSMISSLIGAASIAAGITFGIDGHGGLTPWFLGVVVGFGFFLVAVVFIFALGVIETISYLRRRRLRSGPPPEYDI